ncbi:hypothetical protein EYF80_051527 [Liparis tanakae]|uniref:Uncharacterized protein n=1 Tax=Liparis tanakae TaxID=230148 RepID=A0A4Z2FBS3_9TELE|nr:hypothetical protein EYF80_051527 [Liparis tanakae]
MLGNGVQKGLQAPLPLRDELPVHVSKELLGRKRESDATNLERDNKRLQNRDPHTRPGTHDLRHVIGAQTISSHGTSRGSFWLASITAVSGTVSSSSSLPGLFFSMKDIDGVASKRPCVADRKPAGKTPRRSPAEPRRRRGRRRNSDLPGRSELTAGLLA